MQKIYADIEALRELRHSLFKFAEWQSEAVEAAQAEINYSLSLLEEAEQHWSYQLRSADGMQAEVAAATLEKIHAQQQQVYDASVRHYNAAQQMASVLEHELVQAIAFLDNRIQALEAYYGFQVGPDTVSSVESSNDDAQTDDPERLLIEQMLSATISIVEQYHEIIEDKLGPAGQLLVTQVESRKFGLVASKEKVPIENIVLWEVPGLPLLIITRDSSHIQLEQKRKNLRKVAVPARPKPLTHQQLATLADSLSVEPVPRLAITYMMTPDTDEALSAGQVHIKLSRAGWQMV